MTLEQIDELRAIIDGSTIVFSGRLKLKNALAAAELELVVLREQLAERDDTIAELRNISMYLRTKLAAVEKSMADT